MLKETRDVSKALQRKLEGLADVEHAFVHADYDGTHSISEKYKPLYEIQDSEPKRSIVERVRERLEHRERD